MINCQWTDEELGRAPERRGQEATSLNNNIQLYYLIDAIDLAIEIGMGKRTNTVLQSAFFELADVMPIEDALSAT